MKTLYVRHLTAFVIYRDEITRQLAVQVDGKQYVVNPKPHGPLEEPSDLDECLAALKAEVFKNHGPDYELVLTPAMTSEQAFRMPNNGFQEEPAQATG